MQPWKATSTLSRRCGVRTGGGEVEELAETVDGNTGENEIADIVVAVAPPHFVL